MTGLAFAQTNESDVLVIALVGRLDTQTAPEFDRQLAAASCSRVVLDLAGLDYISSAGLRSVLGALKRARAAGGSLALAAPTPAVREILEISGFATLAPIHPDRASAVAALS